MLGLPQRWHYHPVEQSGVGVRRAIDFLRRSGCAHNIVGGNAALLARQLVAAARPTRAFENTVTDQRLQQRLEMPWRQPMAARQRLGGDWASSRVHRDVDDGGDG